MQLGSDPGSMVPKQKKQERRTAQKGFPFSGCNAYASIEALLLVERIRPACAQAGSLVYARSPLRLLGTPAVEDERRITRVRAW